MSNKFAFVFPGQGSQSLKMMDGFGDLPVIKNTFDIASNAIGIDLLAMLQEDTADSINQTINTQPLLLTASYATYLAWLEKSNNKAPDFVAGHSLGEYSALVASGVIDFVEAVKLVRKRAEYMQAAVKPGEGAMAAVLGLADEIVIDVCQKIMNEGHGVVEGVNFNSVGQIVIAGNKAAVEEASIRLKDSGARKVLPLPVSVPSHCALMKPAAEKLNLELEKIDFKVPKIPIVQNVNAQVSTDVINLKCGLVEQLHSPVLWTKSVAKLAKNHVNLLVECGPGKVLSGLNKRIHESAQIANLQNSADLDKLLEILNQE
ncbi:MAG: [acyl-carrier-protein] S-malonyltransferase [Neisseriaceae bacterium]|nr:MAG: [acyl-carrier-protein] S-malonyltransferase [Neisseriaceae bacterium]